MSGRHKRRMVEKDGHVNVKTSHKDHNFYMRYNLFSDPVGTVAKWTFFEHLLVLLLLGDSMPNH